MQDQDRQGPRPNNNHRNLDGFLTPPKVKPNPPSSSVSPLTYRQAQRTNNTIGGKPKLDQYPKPYLNNSPQPSHTTSRPTETAPGGVRLTPIKPKRSRVSSKGFLKDIRKRRIAAGFVSLLLVALIVSGGWIGWKFLKNASRVFGGSIVNNIGNLFHSTTLNGESVGRVNVLLAGDSADDPHHGGAQLTDSIMLVSIDTKGNNSFLLSIPRDLWVNIPGWSHQKINAANDETNFSQAGYPNGGMGQLEQIVQTQLGIPVNYYALINYTAFRDSVNKVGGISITLHSTDPRGVYDPNISKPEGGPLKLPNGLVTLDGQTALNLARARGDPCGCGKYAYGLSGGDFDRTLHQRQMLVALAQKASSIGVITNPVKVGQLFDVIGNNVLTDLNLADVLRLIALTKNINPNTLQSSTYPFGGTNPILKSYITPNGQAALIPTAGIDNFSQVQQYYQKLVSNSPVAKESANVVVLNGTSTSGLAKQAQTNLTSKGISVVGTSNASKIYKVTTIIDNSNGQKPATLSLLKSLYGNNVTTQQLEVSGYYPDFIVVLGTDQSTPPSTSTTTNTTTTTGQ